MKRGETEKRCVIYTRKSTVKGLEVRYNSLEAQEDICKGFIESRSCNGWRYGGTYCDAGLSGKNTERPELQRLLADAAARRFDYLVVYRMDRLARNQLDFLKILDELAKNDVEVVSVTENFDCTGPVGRAMRNLLGVFAQMEREIIRERCLERAEAARMKGLYPGSRAPFGYRKEEGRLVPDETQAAIVSKAYRLYAAGMGTRKLAQELNRFKVLRLAVRKTAPPLLWSEDAVLKLLKNPVYMGCIRGKLQLYPGQHRRIVAPGLWEAVQRRLRENGARMKKRMSCGATAFFLLQGWLYCANCGRKMCRRSAGRRRIRYYVCRRRRVLGKNGCNTPWLNAEHAEAIVRRFLVPERKCAVDDAAAVRLLGDRVERILYHADEGMLTIIPPGAAGAGAVTELLLRPSHNPKQAVERKTAAPTPAAVCLANAMRLEQLLGSGQFRSPAQLAKVLHVSRSLIYDRLALLNLPPQEMERILFGCAESGGG